MRRRLVAAMLAFVVSPVAAHDILDAVALEDFLARIDRGADADDPEALFLRATALSESFALLDHDRAAHNGGHGPIAQVYLAELARRGIEAAPSPRTGRYPAVIAPFERYLALAGEGDHVGEALLAAIRGRFYDSYLHDPFAADALDWESLRRSIRDGERFAERFPDHPEAEEAAFILAVDYARAAAAAPEAEARAEFRDRALAALSSFAGRYPDSLRAAAAAAVMSRLDVR